jgi:hemerythrin-like metal-binding protein
MQEKWAFEWSDEYISGNEVIDDYHKKIIENIFEIHSMFDTVPINTDKITEHTKILETALLEHMDKEIDYMEEFNLPQRFSHEESHSRYISKLELYKKHSMPPLIYSLLVTEIARDYMASHFFYFDKRDLPRVNEQLKLLNTIS